MKVNKPVVSRAKLLIAAGKASPAPPVGPILGQRGVKAPDFCKQFNERSGVYWQQLGDIGKNFVEEKLIVRLEVYKDKSFSFEIFGPQVSNMISRALKLSKASSTPGHEFVGTLDAVSLENIAKIKIAFMNTLDLSAAMKMVVGTAKSMGLLFDGVS